MYKLVKFLIKKILPLSIWIEVKAFVKSFLYFFNRFKKTKNNTVLIHIGKCGGSTLKKAVLGKYKEFPFDIVHIEKPIFKTKCKYIIIARGPINRAISSFNWRYKLVVEDEIDKRRFNGEYEVLTKYKTLNNIAEKLYFGDGDPNKLVHKEIKKIHHIKENISFYLSNFLKKCSPKQIQAVIMQENLNSDLKMVFDVNVIDKIKVNKENKINKQLSSKAIEHLRKYLSEDYAALELLYSYGKINKDIYAKLF
jgi:hypothetical protein